MIPLLMITLIKRFFIQYCEHRSFKLSKTLKYPFRPILIAFLLLSFIPIASKCQALYLNYTITKGGDNIGWLRLEKITAGSTTKLLLVSEIKVRFIFLITAYAKDSSIFENRKMIYSSQLRKTNGSIKQNKQTRLVAEKYEVAEDGEKENLSISFIGINLLSLYFQEPIGINTVYCDINKCFAPIVKTDDGGYKVKRPDGNSTTFYYSGGTCRKIIICQSFYTVVVVLNQ